jgi:hypothetical protein
LTLSQLPVISSLSLFSSSIERFWLEGEKFWDPEELELPMGLANGSEVSTLSGVNEAKEFDNPLSDNTEGWEKGENA